MPIVPKDRVAIPVCQFHFPSPPPRRRPPVAFTSPADELASPAQQIESPAFTASDYEVGYKRPPRHSQFRPGQSGNSKGRPKGAKGLKTLVRELLTQKVDVRSATGVKRMTKMEAMLQKILEQAFSGNLRALSSFVALYQMAVPDDPVVVAGAMPTIDMAELDREDQAILDQLFAARQRQIGGSA